MARGIVGRGPKVPGGLALGTFLALATGVALWWVVDSLFPPLGNAVRGTRRVKGE